MVALVLLAELIPPLPSLPDEPELFFKEDDPLVLLTFLPEEDELDLDFLSFEDEPLFLLEELLLLPSPELFFFPPILELNWASVIKPANKIKRIIYACFLTIA